MNARRGISLFELVVGIVAVAVGLAALLLWLDRSRHPGYTTANCAMRLKGFGTSCGVYASGYNDAWPSIGSSEQYDADGQAYESFADLVATGGACGLQHYWVLVYEGNCGEEQLSCPSDDGYEKSDYLAAGGRFGFASGWAGTSYGMQPATRHEKNKAWPGAPGMDPNTVIMGDKWAPGGTGLTWNHADGGNFLRFDYSVAWEEFPRGGDGVRRGTFGWKDNDVFQIDLGPSSWPTAPTRKGLPAHPSDSYLYWRLPTTGRWSQGAGGSTG